MKIALEVGTPDPELLTAFVQAFAGSATIKLDGLGQAHEQVIAAYDDECGRLVGLGSRVESAADQAPALQVIIAPGYELRGIDALMEKLMLPRSGRLITAG